MWDNVSYLPVYSGVQPSLIKNTPDMKPDRSIKHFYNNISGWCLS